MILKEAKKKTRKLTSEERVIMGLKAVRDSGKTNMLDKKAVAYWAFQMGFFETVTFVSEASAKKYIERLTSDTNLYHLLPEIDTTELIELNDNLEARGILEEQYFFTKF